MNYTYSDKVNAMRPSIIRELLKQTADPTLISFAGGNPDPEAFPAAQFAEISDALLKNEPAACLQYSITEGYGPLREAGKAYIQREFPVMGEGDDIVIMSGSQQVMDFMAKLLCNEGDVVATEDPAFLGGLNSYRSHGARLAGVPMEGDGVNLAALENVLSASPRPRFFYTIPNFQNPTGQTTSLAKRRAIYELCVKYGVPVLEDNPYGELRISGEALPPIKSFDKENAVVYAVSMSKVLAPGMRVAFCVGEAGLMGKMVVAKQGNDVHTNLLAQRICERFLTTCDLDAHLARLREIYTKKATLMTGEIDRLFGSEVAYVHPAGGMFVWLTLPADVDMLTFVQKCLAKKLAIVPGNAFFVDENAPCNSVRLNFSGPSFAQITEGVQTMRDVFCEMRG